MIRILRDDDLVVTPPVGGPCPYWAKIDGRIVIADTAEEIIRAVPWEDRVIDPVGVAELLQFNYMLGDRTLVRGVQRVPARARFHGNGEIERSPPLPHGSARATPRQVAIELREVLIQETLAATKGRTLIYILLTGGLDSRVVAGVLKSIEPSISTRITAVTWGAPDSRDVVYAKRIAEMYGWPHEHLAYDPELVWSNLERGAVWGGSEVSGIHLHGMAWFRFVPRSSLVIAGSWGDSVGRAEFSGVHISKLRPMPIVNAGDLIRKELYATVRDAAANDRAKAWESETTGLGYARAELDMQENYMRRMIGHAMDYVRQFADVHQAFTSPRVLSFMWGLHPQDRGDDIYRELLFALDPRLAAIPWARTGVAPDGTKERNSALKAQYHELGRWLREELAERLQPLFDSPELRALGFLDDRAMTRLWARYRREPHDALYSAENVSKLASIEISRRVFDLQPCGPLHPDRPSRRAGGPS